MADKLSNIQGLQEWVDSLRALPVALRRGALRNALAAGGRVFRDEARRLSPVLVVPVRKRGKLIRKTGTLRKAITVRTSRRDRRAGDVGVFVNVRPAKSGKRGADNPDDPFYWRWLEFGRKGRASAAARARVVRIKFVRKGVRARRAMRAVGPISPMKFLQGATAKVNEALRRITAALGPAIDKMNKKGGTK